MQFLFMILLSLTSIMKGTTRLNHQIYKLNNIFLNWDNLNNLSLPLGPYILDKNKIILLKIWRENKLSKKGPYKMFFA